jgi:hypothetical protein
MILALAAAAAFAGVVQTAPPDLEAVYAPRRVALLVGVQEYADPALQGLRFPAKDAADLGAALADPAIGGFDQVVVLSGAVSTSGAAIRQAIAVATADLQRDDTVLLYFSGHGTLTLDPAEGSRLWFLPSDGALDDPAHTGLAIAELEDLVSALPARRRVIIFDTCHDGRSTGPLLGRAHWNAPTTQLIAGLRGEPPAPRGLRAVSESEARLFAAQVHQPAMEDPTLQNGVYTHHLIAALTDKRRQADLDGDGLVDVTEAHDWARDGTIRHTGGLQVPRAEYRIVGREEIWLAGDPGNRSQAEAALLAACDELLAKARLFVDGVPRGGGVGLTAVEPGRREVELRSESGALLGRQRLDLRAGQTYSLENLIRKDQGVTYVTSGALLRHGAGAATMQPLAGELELGLIAPLGHGLGGAAYARTALSGGPVAEQGDLPVFVGESALGGSLGPTLGPLLIGPAAELLLPYRSFTNETGAHHQATLTGALGARATLRLPVGGVELVARLDSRFVPYEHDAAWTSLWHHGLAVGVGRPRP